MGSVVSLSDTCPSKVSLLVCRLFCPPVFVLPVVSVSARVDWTRVVSCLWLVCLPEWTGHVSSALRSARGLPLLRLLLLLRCVLLCAHLCTPILSRLGDWGARERERERELSAECFID